MIARHHSDPCGRMTCTTSWLDFFHRIIAQPRVAITVHPFITGLGAAIVFAAIPLIAFLLLNVNGGTASIVRVVYLMDPFAAIFGSFSVFALMLLRAEMLGCGADLLPRTSSGSFLSGGLLGVLALGFVSAGVKCAIGTANLLSRGGVL